MTKLGQMRGPMGLDHCTRTVRQTKHDTHTDSARGIEFVNEKLSLAWNLDAVRADQSSARLPVCAVVAGPSTIRMRFRDGVGTAYKPSIAEARNGVTDG
jgi:hypothetical protein